MSNTQKNWGVKKTYYRPPATTRNNGSIPGLKRSPLIPVDMPPTTTTHTHTSPDTSHITPHPSPPIEYKRISELPFYNNRVIEQGQPCEIVEINSDKSNWVVGSLSTGPFSNGPFIKAKFRSLAGSISTPHGATATAEVEIVETREIKKQTVTDMGDVSFYFVTNDQLLTKTDIDAMIQQEIDDTRQKYAARLAAKAKAEAEAAYRYSAGLPKGGRKSRRSKSNKNKRTRRKSAKRQYRRRK